MNDVAQRSDTALGDTLAAMRAAHARNPVPDWRTRAQRLRALEALLHDNRDAIDAAIRVAVARRWLRVDGDPPESITLTGDGVKLLEPAKPK